jgi:hypothetical protein
MSLKLGPLPDRNPVKLAISLAPDVHEALGDYAALHAKSYGKEAPLADLAALMIEEFLNRDAVFKRARKALGKNGNSKE